MDDAIKLFLLDSILSNAQNDSRLFDILVSLMMNRIRSRLKPTIHLTE